MSDIIKDMCMGYWPGRKQLRMKLNFLLHRGQFVHLTPVQRMRKFSSFRRGKLIYWCSLSDLYSIQVSVYHRWESSAFHKEVCLPKGSFLPLRSWSNIKCHVRSLTSVNGCKTKTPSVYLYGGIWCLAEIQRHIFFRFTNTNDIARDCEGEYSDLRFDNDKCCEYKSRG